MGKMSFLGGPLNAKVSQGISVRVIEYIPLETKTARLYLARSDRFVDGLLASPYVQSWMELVRLASVVFVVVLLFVACGLPLMLGMGYSDCYLRCRDRGGLGPHIPPGSGLPALTTCTSPRARGRKGRTVSVSTKDRVSTDGSAVSVESGG